MTTMHYTILLIDDSDDDILLTKRALTRINTKINIETASSGEAGLVFLRNCATLPSLVLLDLKMPKMDGIEVLLRIRKETGLHRVPVVIVTHSELESDKQAAYKAGADNFLQKATNPDHFKKGLKNVLDCWLGRDSPHL